MPPKRKYHDDYLKFGFTCIEVNGEVKPQCVICATVLSNDALKPAKLERHLRSVHPTLSDKPLDYFQGKIMNLKKMKLGPSGVGFASNTKALVASFEIAKLIAEEKKPYTIGERLIKPSLLKAVEVILGEEAKKKLQQISLSNDTVKIRIEKMSHVVEEQLLTKISQSPYFALQCDETTDVAQCCQLLTFVRFLDVSENTFKEEMLFMESLETTARGIDILDKIGNYFQKHNLKWDKLAGCCTDGAPAMLGTRSGFATLLKKKNASLVTTHCIIHKQALAVKTLPEELADVLKTSIKLVNTVKGSALNTRVFKKLCSDLNAEHEVLLFHTEVRWLSKGCMLQRLYELKEELKEFLTTSDKLDLLAQFEDQKFQAYLAYLVDVFSHLNKLNMQLQGSGNENLKETANIFVFEDKIRAFLCKIKLWHTKVKDGNFSGFPTLKDLIDHTDFEEDSITDIIQDNIIAHLESLTSEFTRYFPEYGVCEMDPIRRMVRNPFNVDVTTLPDDVQEELIELQNDSNCKDNFKSQLLEEFWCKKALSYPKVRNIALKLLTLFSTTYLCEQGFSNVLAIKTKQRSKLGNPEFELRLAVAKSITPRIGILVKSMQAQPSH